MVDLRDYAGLVLGPSGIADPFHRYHSMVSWRGSLDQSGNDYRLCDDAVVVRHGSSLSIRLGTDCCY